MLSSSNLLPDMPLSTSLSFSGISMQYAVRYCFPAECLRFASAFPYLVSPIAALDAGKTTGIWGVVLGGLAHLIFGNAVPGCVLGILIGQTIEEQGFSKSAKIMCAVVAALFIVIGIGRGFWAKLLAAFIK